MSAIHPSELAFITKHAPFDRMELAHVLWMLERMSMGYYAAGEVIVSPEQGAVDRFLVIKQGVVHGEQSVAKATDTDTWMELAEGECFPLGALLANRPVASIYRAGSDTFCYELAAADFLELIATSAAFRDFCTRRIANLLEHSKQVIQAQYSHSSAEQQSLASPLSSVIRRAPVTCAPDATIRQVLEIMREQRIGSMVAVDEEGRPLGIMTLHDVLDRIAIPQIDLDLPVMEVMSTELSVMPPQALAHEAALMMAKHGFRHVLVVEDGKLAGLVSEKDLFALQRVGLRQIGATIRHAETPQVLQQAATDIRKMAHNMMAQGVAPEQLTQFISAFNDLLTARVVELECKSSGLLGTPLHDGLCWMALGSEGRFEQTLNTDQDNAIIFEVPQGMTADQVREKLLPVARRINETLDLCGFPLCKGEIMASNPKWCLSLEEWKRTFNGWIGGGSPESLLNASIFFDFRSLYGAEHLAEDLRVWLARAAADNSRFLHMMAGNALRNRPPLGVVRDFVLGKGNTLDLKMNGITPFVDAARIFALAAGVSQTNTIQRLRLSAAKMRLPESEIDAWIDALLFIQVLRLRHHDEVSERGAGDDALDNLIDPETLNELDRRILKEAFRQARKLQSRLALEYQL
ncbi:MAG: CBS domain-containing protein [Gammaproteobacteria bacterium]|nr:CBS domain-containing protein [Gammaproteobacteria bacterium]MBU1777197.1 CBS domain-containing protein [Gammaproteobacteria bacterium]MBU1968855.1 CBS domain-containing protein [Gammaproteobacteria bacterium]